MSGAARIVIESRPGETRACAVDEHDRPLAFRIERETDPSLVGAICLGRVRAVRKEIGAAFVDIGGGDDGSVNAVDSTSDEPPLEHIPPFRIVTCSLTPPAETRTDCLTVHSMQDMVSGHIVHGLSVRDAG